MTIDDWSKLLDWRERNPFVISADTAGFGKYLGIQLKKELFLQEESEILDISTIKPMQIHEETSILTWLSIDLKDLI